MQNVSRASSAQAVSSRVTVRVEGHVTPGLESAASDVLQASVEINVSWVRRKAASMHRFRFRQLCWSTERQLNPVYNTHDPKNFTPQRTLVASTFTIRSHCGFTHCEQVWIWEVCVPAWCACVYMWDYCLHTPWLSECVTFPINCMSTQMIIDECLNLSTFVATFFNSPINLSLFRPSLFTLC